MKHILSSPSPRLAPVEAPRRVSVLGSTGSIGRNTAEILAAAQGRFEVEALIANSNAALLAEQARALGARIAVAADESVGDELKARLHEEAEHALERARVIGDVLIGAFFAEKKDKARLKEAEKRKKESKVGSRRREKVVDLLADVQSMGGAAVRVSYLRKKLNQHGPPLIHTVRLVGYVLREADET